MDLRVRAGCRASRAPAIMAGFAAVLLGASASEAQVGSRISGRLEGGGSLLVSSPQSDRFGFGFMGRFDLGVRLAGPFAIHGFAAVHQWPESDSAGQFTGAGPGRATLVGGGLGLEPALSSRVRLRFEGDLGVSLNGSESDARLSWGVGVGALFGLAKSFDLGPIMRIGGVLAAGDEGTDQGGPGSAMFLSFGLAMSFHGAEDEAPPPQETVFVAPPPQPVYVAPVAVVAPTPLVVFSAPTAQGVSVGGGSVQGAAQVGLEPEPRGRHRHGRHGGRHRGGGRHHGGGGRHHRRH